LNQICFNYEYRPHSPPLTSSFIKESSQRRLQVLDLFALLLVTGSSGDVAAIAQVQPPEQPDELWYSKNRPCTKVENKYIMGLFKIITNTSLSANIRQENLFGLVLPNCQGQITKRMRNIGRIFKSLVAKSDLTNPWYRSPTNQACIHKIAQCENHIRALEGSERFPITCSLIVFLKNWFTQLGSLSGPSAVTPVATPNFSFLHESINIAYLLASGLGNSSVLDEGLEQSIGNLADYHLAVVTLVHRNSDLAPPGLALSIKEIATVSSITHRFPQDILTILNDWAAYKNISEVTQESLDAAYPQRSEPATSKASMVPNIKSRVHCESGLALAFTELCLTSEAMSTIEIGVSKSSCWLCREYANILQRIYRHIKIHVSSHHGQLTAGWRLPPRTPPEVQAAMNKRIQDALEDVISRCAKKLRPDTMSHTLLRVRDSKLGSYEGYRPGASDSLALDATTFSVS
ncbi:hypothetical protein HOY80DRAFT_1092404, partial [Tuber brumale]